MAQKILKIVGGIWFIGMFFLGVLAYFVTSAGPSDGLGRPLTEAPIVMRILFGQDRLWAGWGWFAIDMAVFWGSIAAVVGISKRLGRGSDG